MKPVPESSRAPSTGICSAGKSEPLPLFGDDRAKDLPTGARSLASALRRGRFRDGNASGAKTRPSARMGEHTLARRRPQACGEKAIHRRSEENKSRFRLRGLALVTVRRSPNARAPDSTSRLRGKGSRRIQALRFSRVTRKRSFSPIAGAAPLFRLNDWPGQA